MAAVMKGRETYVMRLATWNVHEGRSKERSSGQEAMLDVRATVADLVSEHGIDVIALQELDLDADGESVIMTELSTRTELRHTFVRRLSASALVPNQFSGVGIASAFPVRQVSSGLLPNPQQTVDFDFGEAEVFDKGWISGRICGVGGEFDFLSLHAFPLHRFGADLGDPRFAPVWASLAADVQRLSERCVIAGDFNTTDRELLFTFVDRGLVSVFSDVPTHGSRSVDDVLLSEALEMSNGPFTVETFSDHDLCVVDISLPGVSA